MAAVPAAVTRYPIEARGLRRRTRSAATPPASLARAERPSAVPSIHPSTAGPAPRARRKEGRTAVASSCDTSEKRLASEMPRVVRLSQPSPGAAPGMPGGAFTRAPGTLGEGPGRDHASADGEQAHEQAQDH